MKVAIIVFPGSNCDRDVYVAVKDVMKLEPIMVWHGEHFIPSVDLIILPGGFSYGDYLRSGAMAARSNIMQHVVKMAHSGVKVMGICNGFQILTEAGLLPGTLMRNKHLKFIGRDVNLKVVSNNNYFTKTMKPNQIVNFPIAHQEGNYFVDEQNLKFMEDNEMVVLRYSDATGQTNDENNPNGAVHHIAGIVSREKNVFGLMPHPERSCDPLTGGIDGRYIFEALR